MKHTKHTPGPWLMRYNGKTEHLDILGANGIFVTNVYNEANAEFITRACNSHYELLDALEKIEQQLDYGQLETALKITREAIAKATGE